jgi:hypothetical protein
MFAGKTLLLSPNYRQLTHTRFWKNHGEGCRFTAEECMNLHEDLPTGASYPLRNGKPTWGSKADLALSATSPSASGFAPLDPRHRTLTCHFWKTGKCTKSAEKCNYLHADSPAGVAKRPGSYMGQIPKARTMESWVKSVNKEGESGSEENGEELILEVKDEQGSVWGEPSPWAGGDTGSTWGDDKYKPPHVVALENKVMHQNHG